MHTINFQIQDDLYESISSKGLDINKKVQEFLYTLVDDGYPSIGTEEAKRRVSDAVAQYRNGTMKTVPHNEMWDKIEADCKV